MLMIVPAQMIADYGKILMLALRRKIMKSKVEISLQEVLCFLVILYILFQFSALLPGFSVYLYANSVLVVYTT